MQSQEIRQKFLDFFEKRGHAILPSASLVPENDPSVLFTTAGMQPLVPYLLGEAHPKGEMLASVQKCVRTQDIDEIGDNTHDTFFEMLGNWSLGSYFKKEAITWSYEFLTSKDEGLRLDPSKLYVTVFEGNEDAPRDEESFEIWKSLGVPEHRIYFMDAKSNWWSPGEDGPCGPDSEMFYDVTDKGLGDMTKEEFIAADDRQDVVEIWNDVFMEYEKKEGKVVGKLAKQNVDTGAGLERLVMVMQGKNNIFDTDLFEDLITHIREHASNENIRAERIFADHIRTATFMIADGVTPSNTDSGYILRRLLRRAVRYGDVLGISKGILFEFAGIVIKKYEAVYPNLGKQSSVIEEEIRKEEVKFRETLEKGMKEFEKISHANISGRDAFVLFSTYGFPFEMTEELAEEHGISVNEDEYKAEMEKHQELSRTASAGKFKGGVGGDSPEQRKYHTATHLLQQALRDVLGNHVTQKGSNITDERLRFDFTHGEKMSAEEKVRVEDIVNEKINDALPISFEEMSVDEARELGALGIFDDKYGDKVKVYTVGEKDDVYSREICGGPHVENTSELGKFRIKKEEASSAGVRRIKAVLE
ncbi:alanine--tRNA ligase [Patescibacteria group bacterium]